MRSVANHEPTTYRMKPGSAKSFVKLGYYLIVMVWTAFSLSFAITCWAERDSGWTRGTFFYLALQLVLLLTVGAAVSFFNLRFFKGWAQRMETLEIVLHDDHLLRRQQGHPDLTILRSEITHLGELGESGLFIRGGHRFKQVFVPPTLEGYPELRTRLLAWSALTPTHNSRWLWVILISGALLPHAMHFAPHWINNSVGYSVAAASFVWAFIEFRRNPNVDANSRKMAWLFLIPASVLAWFAVR